MIGLKEKGIQKFGVGVGRTVVGDITEFHPLHKAEIEGVGILYVGQDRKLYRKTTSLMKVVAPCLPTEAEEDTTRVYLEKVDWEDFPPLDELKYLFETFLRQYDREVMFVIGKRWEGAGFFYMVPKQEGTTGSISWEDKEGMGYFAGIARFIGTVHIHPGNCAEPSGTDTSNWAKLEQTGLHMIFGRDGSYTIHGSAAEQVVPLIEGKLEETVGKPVDLDLMGRELSTLLLVPPPPKWVSMASIMEGKRAWRGTKGPRRDRLGPDRLVQGFDWEEWEQNRYLDAGGGFPLVDVAQVEVGWLLQGEGALVLEPGELDHLCIIRHEGKAYMLTRRQLKFAQLEAESRGITLPVATPVRRAVVKGGRV